MTMLLAVLVACSAPAASTSACIPGVATDSCPCYCGTSGTVVNGTVHIEYSQPSANVVSMNFDVPGGTVKWARVYWHIWGATPAGHGWSNATFCNGTGCCDCNQNIPAIITPGDNCEQSESCGFYMGGYGTHWVYWNVTDCITAGYNNLTVDNSGWSDGRVMHMKLVAVIEEMEDFPSNLFPTTNYWINQGYVDQPPAYTTWFNGSINSSRNCTLWHLALANHQMNISFNGHDVKSYPWKTGYYGEKAEFIPAGWVEGDGSQNMTWDPFGDDPHPVEAVLVDNDYYYLEPDLVIEEMEIEHMNGSCYGQTPTGFVANHIYDVDALVKNRGGVVSGAFNVCLYDDADPVDTKRVSNLNLDEGKWVRFQWNPTTSGNPVLRVMADNDSEVDESLESNNNMTQSVTVLAEGTPDLEAYPCCIDFSPTWWSNATDITVTVLNNGTGDASNFKVEVTMYSSCLSPNPWTDSTTTSVCAKAYKKVTFTSPELIRYCNYTVNASLDSDGVVTESEETNNNETKYFHAIHVKLKVSHHYGNMSAYNGVLSDDNSVVMFALHKNVTNYTTPYKLLISEADVFDGDGDGDIDGINVSGAAAPGTSTWYLNRSVGKPAPECPEDRPIYWYLFVNGIPTPDMPTRMYNYTFKDCEVMHMDLLKYVNSGNGTNFFKPRPIMDFPEPFKHGGYGGLVADTTIVHPDDPDWLTIANNIKATLVSCGISSARIHVSTDDAVGGAKNTDHLILIGTPLANSLIVDATDGSVNANHTEIGMPMYFDTADPDAIRLYDDWLYNDDDPDVPNCCSEKNSSYHSVVMACDNPFDNNAPWTDTWMDDNLTMWIASGVTECYAEDAANMLTIGCSQLLWDDKGFWNKTRDCADVDGDCTPKTMMDAIALLSGDIRTSLWAADVDGDCTPKTMMDAIALLNGNLNCHGCGGY